MDPNLVKDAKKYKDTMREHGYLSELCALYDEYKKVLSGIKDAKEMITNEDDAEMREMAREELNSKNGFIENEVVYHWAREYFVDGIADKEKAEKVQKQVEKMSDLSKVKVNKDISEDRKERMRQALSKAKAELHQQEFNF
jgi:protein subunit release factor A